MFEETINQMLRWGLGIGFLYWCYRSPQMRLLGYAVGGLCILAALVRDFVTLPGLDNGEMWAWGIVILCVCFFSRFKTNS
jgi:hypothetical protein